MKEQILKIVAAVKGDCPFAAHDPAQSIYKAACDAIKQKLSDFSPWVSVEDRLPDAPGRYWCFVAEQADLGLSHYQWNYSYSEQDGWGIDDGGQITHWMPLPEPPKAK